MTSVKAIISDNPHIIKTPAIKIKTTLRRREEAMHNREIISNRVAMVDLVNTIKEEVLGSSSKTIIKWDTLSRITRVIKLPINRTLINIRSMVKAPINIKDKDNNIKYKVLLLQVKAANQESIMEVHLHLNLTDLLGRSICQKKQGKENYSYVKSGTQTRRTFTIT
jgi:hypothetical protein